MFFRVMLLSLAVSVFTGSGLTMGQQKAPAVAGPDLKEAQKAVWEKDWFPKETRDPLQQVLDAVSLSDRAKSIDNLPEAYATFIEAIKLSDSANEWNLSRDIFRETAARFEVHPDALKKWYQQAIRKTEFGARLAELVDLLANEVLNQNFDGTPEDWEPVHRQLVNRLKASQYSATQFSCRERLTQIENRLQLQQKEQTKLWQGITSIVKSNEIAAGIKLLAEAADKTVSEPAAAWSVEKFSFDNCQKLLAALVKLKDPNAREAAIRIFESIISKLTYAQISDLQDVCYSLSHELSGDFSLPYYDHQQDPGREVRLDVLKTRSGQRNVRFVKDQKAWEVNGECWFDYIQMPVTNTVHDIEFTATKISSFFKFRYGAHNSLRVGFEPVGKDRFRLRHERAYGNSRRIKRSKDSFAYGDRVKLTVFTMCGRQFVVINGKYASERTLDNVWTSHQFVTEGGTQLKLFKSTLRSWVAGDRERMLLTFGDHSSLRCTRTSPTSWNRDELIRYTEENNANRRKLGSMDDPFINELGLVMQPIPAGEFQQGDTTFKLTNSFWVSQHEISQRQWEQLMGSNPASIQGNAHFPVDNLSYSDAIKFCKRLNALAKKKRQLPDGYVYRLLTEAEWEYVCRAGKSDDFSVKNDGFWHRLSAEARYHAVGTGSPNPFKLYDMHGNVEEFTFDQYVKRPDDQAGVQADPIHPPDEKDDHISIRGGSWCNLAEDCTSQKRKTGLMERCPYRGLRVALVPVKK